MDSVDRLEKQLTLSNNQIQVLKTTIVNLEHQISTLQAKCALYDTSIRKQPFAFLQEQERQRQSQSQSHQADIELLENKVACSTWQLLHLQRLYEQRGGEISTLSQKVMELQRVCSTNRLASQTKQLESLEKDSRILIYEQQLQSKITNNLKDIKDRKALMEENFRLKQQLLEAKNASYAVKVEAIASALEKQSGFSQDKWDKEHQNEQQKYLQTLQGELDERTQQLAKLMSQGSMDPLTSREQSMQHTLKCLKEELKKKSGLLKEIIEKYRSSLELIKRFQTTSQELEKVIDQKQNLAIKYQKERQANLELNNQGQSMQEEIDRMHYETENYQGQMLELLLENECYHDFMWNEHKAYYMKVIHEEREKMCERIKKREQTQKWTSISELIKVNIKLKMMRN